MPATLSRAATRATGTVIHSSSIAFRAALHGPAPQRTLKPGETVCTPEMHLDLTNPAAAAWMEEQIARVIREYKLDFFRLDFQWRLLLFVRPTFGFLKQMGADWNPLLLGRIQHWLALYKNFVRPFQSAGRIYHHTPVVPGPEPQDWGVLELASEDRTRAVCGLFQLGNPTQQEYRLRLRGLDAGRRYRVTRDNTGQIAEADGCTLMNEGITVRLEGALTSELLLVTEEAKGKTR